MITVAAQVGCLTFGIIFVALLAGLGLDRLFGTRGLFTILLILASVPVTWVGVFYLVNRARKVLEPSKTASTPGIDFDAEENESER